MGVAISRFHRRARVSVSFMRERARCSSSSSAGVCACGRVTSSIFGDVLVVNGEERFEVPHRFNTHTHTHTHTQPMVFSDPPPSPTVLMCELHCMGTLSRFARNN